LKKSCGTWFLVYLAAAVVIGAVAYRRFPVAQAVIVPSLIGAGLLWFGLGYLTEIRRKLREAMMIGRTRAGEPARDGQKISAIGRIVAIGPTLTSPLSRTACIAYKYEIRDAGTEHNTIRFHGFALTPSAIQTPQGSVRLLAYPDLKVKPQFVPDDVALANAQQYIGESDFREFSLQNMGKTFKEMMDAYKDDDGSIRTDQCIRKDANLQNANFVEWLLRPGDEVCAIGRYSSRRGGIVPNPKSAILDRVTIEQGPPEVFARRSIRGAIGYLIGGLIFVAIVAGGLLALYTLVPLEASEQMSPTMKASWPEIRLERLIETRIRGPLRQAGMLSNETVANSLEPGFARGRMKAGGREETVSRAAAARTDGNTSINLDNGLVVLVIDEKGRLLQLRVFSREVDPRAADLRISDNDRQVAGRLTLLPDHADVPACRVAFRAKVH
jgi:hypothetical protein